MECGDELLRMRALILVDESNGDLRCFRALRAENPGEDGEEDDRHDEREDRRGAVASEIHPAGAHDRENHSRSALPVRCRNTFSSVGIRIVTSRTARPRDST